MKPLPSLALLAFAFTGLAAFAAEPPPTEVVQIDSAAVAKGGALLANSLFKVQQATRTGPGAFVEIHTHDTDIFRIIEGTADFMTGGKPVDVTHSGPGEERAKDMVGGTLHHLTQGDVIIIPHGIPHRYVKVYSKKFVYFVVKVTQ